MLFLCFVMFFFFFNDTATTEIYTLSLHDALPIFRPHSRGHAPVDPVSARAAGRSSHRGLATTVARVRVGGAGRSDRRRLPARVDRAAGRRRPPELSGRPGAGPR